MKKTILAVAVLAAAGALILLLRPAPPPAAERAVISTGSNGPWVVTVQLDDPDHLAADEPVLLILEIRNSSDQAIRIDPISLQSSSMELELTRPSGARESVRSGLGPYLRNEAGVEIPSGGSVRYHEAFLPDEPGAWTASVSLRLTPQDLERKSTVVRLPSVRFQAGPQAPAVTQAVRSDHFDRLLLGQEKFLTETDGPKLERLEAAASPRLRRYLALARGMTLALSHRFGYRKEDQDAIRLLENYIAQQPQRPLTDVALVGLAKIYSQSRPYQEAGDSERDAREFRRVADRLRRDHPSSSITLGELPYYEQ